MVEISIKIVDCLHAWKTPPAIAVSAEKVYALKTNQATFERKYKFVYFSLLSFGMIAYAFLTTKPAQLFQGLYRIYFNPCHLFSDFVAIGGFGATLMNIALIILVELLVIWRSKGTQTGTIITSIFTTVGYAFFGTSLFNFLPILLGVYLYARLEKIPFNTLLLQAFMGSAIGPLINYIAFGLGLDPALGIGLGFLVGLVIGLITSPLSSAFLRFHQGYNLYNLGFTAGMIGMIAVAIMRQFKVEIEAVSVLGSEHSLQLTIFALILFLSFFLFSFYLKGWDLKDYRKLMKSSGRLLTDFVQLYSSGMAFFNMGIIGLIGLGFLKLVNAPINGPVIGACITASAFAAIGKHPRNVLPLMIGTSLATLLHGSFQSTATILAILFGMNLAPIAGQFGWLAGILAGYLHVAVVGHVLPLHAGFNLYNNGFSAGFVAAFLVPLIESVKRIYESRTNNE